MSNRHLSHLNPLPKISICSYLDAKDYLAGKLPTELITSLISIGDPGGEHLPGIEIVPLNLRLEFYDLNKSDHKPDCILATREDIAKIIQFIDSIFDKTSHLLIHCHAGISRSTAVGLIVWAYLLGDGKEEEALANVLAAQPYAMPNRLLIQLADEMLHRNGKLLKVLDSI